MDDFYREMIIDHGQNMRNRGLLDPADIDYEDDNPLCGDRLRLTVQLDDEGRVKAVGWDGEGCVISQASASMLGEEMLGKTLDELRAIDKDHILEMMGIPLTPVRLKCALLALKVLKAGAYGLTNWTDDDDE
ncbi:MAG: iron-sulfur cluster assembly scaffold protein [Anaerolineae bacterium]|nr:iron-sulfur cluster assembly scaffold protein [Anaerolineae bacterium]